MELSKEWEFVILEAATNKMFSYHEELQIEYSKDNPDIQTMFVLVYGFLRANKLVMNFTYYYSSYYKNLGKIFKDSHPHVADEFSELASTVETLSNDMEQSFQNALIDLIETMDSYLIDSPNREQFIKAILNFELTIEKDIMFNQIKFNQKIDDSDFRKLILKRIGQQIQYIRNIQLTIPILTGEIQKIQENENQLSGEQNEPIYPETELNVEFNPQIFKDEYSSRLFCYLIDSYHNGKDVELSNIYQWMENKKLIHQNKRQEYKDFVKSNNITNKEYSRVHSSNEYKPDKLDPTFNELKKQFDRKTK